jgi:hypothetical protein
MLELKNITGIITNSSSEVYVFDNLNEDFMEMIKSYTGDLNFIVLRSKEDVNKVMTSPTAQEKLLEYCDLPVGWLNLDETKKEEAYTKLLGKTFLFNYLSDPEESKFWYPEAEEHELIKDKYIETYVG